MFANIQSSNQELTTYKFDSFLRKILEQAQHTGVGGKVVVDLRTLSYIDLFGMVGIIFCCKDLLDHYGCDVKLEMGEFGESSACNFLPRIGFFDVLDPRVELSPTFTPQRLEWERQLRGGNKRFLELTRLDSPSVVTTIPGRLADAIWRQLHQRDGVAADMGSAIAEVCLNIHDHNPDDCDAVAAMQVSNNSSERFMQFVVADRGAGILSTLRRNGLYTGINSDVEAILKSTEVGVTCVHDDVTRGNGLPKLLELALKHKGSVLIRSGSGKVYWRSNATRREFWSVPRLQGTQIVVTIQAVYK